MMKKKQELNFLLVIIAMVVVFAALFLYSSLTGPIIESMDGKLNNMKSDIIKENVKPILKILDVEFYEYIDENGNCYSVVEGFISNRGYVDAMGVLVECQPHVFSLLEEGELKKGSKNFEIIGKNSDLDFEVKIEGCLKRAQFECFASCDNC